MNNTKWHKGLLKKLTQRAKTPLFVFLGGAILGVGALLIMSGNLTLPMITISPTQVAGGLNSFFALEDDAIRFGENTIRISRHRLDMGNKRITNLAAPVAATDAATRGFVLASSVPSPVFAVSCAWMSCSIHFHLVPGACTPPACPAGSTELGHAGCSVAGVATNIGARDVSTAVCGGSSTQINQINLAGGSCARICRVN